MRIQGFKIENLRNIKLAEYDELPNFVVICGKNGCGKSSFLDALITAKKIVFSYAGENFKQNLIMANTDQFTISLTVQYSQTEIQNYHNRNLEIDTPEKEIFTVIKKGSNISTQNRPSMLKFLLRQRNYQSENSRIFDYYSPDRKVSRNRVSAYDPSNLHVDRIEETLIPNDNKFRLLKQFLLKTRMQYLQSYEHCGKNNMDEPEDPFGNIKETFSEIFSHMEFKTIDVETNPFKFIISTPNGDIDFDDLSSGEKEILSMIIRYHQMNPKDSVILIDEAESHLHPELAKKYCKLLKSWSKDNQVIITTHSPSIMMEAGHESLFTLQKYSTDQNKNQFHKVANDEEIYDILKDLMGTSGIIGFDKKIVFVEGNSTSPDIDIFEQFFSNKQIKFISAGDCNIISQTSKKVEKLLSTSCEYNDYYGIVDGDMNVFGKVLTQSQNLFILPVYHIENYLLDEEIILKVEKDLNRASCKYNSKEEIEKELKDLLLDKSHLNKFIATYMNYKKYIIFQEIKEELDNNKEVKQRLIKFNDYVQEAKKILEDSISNGDWKRKCVGRVLLTSYCNKNHHNNYKQFKNLLISKMIEMEKPIEDLSKIINKIVS